MEPSEALVIMDWAMKFLPLSYREKQSEWFAQKGINWHVCVCIFKDSTGTVKHRTFVHLFNQVKQDWFAVASILEHTLTSLKSQIPYIEMANIRSDNAGCYHCGNFFYSLIGIGERAGIQIKRFDFSESQCGKSSCDSKIAHLRSKIRQYASNGNDVKSAADMKKAIDSVGGVVGCQAAYVDVNLDAYATWVQGKPWKGISKIHDIEFRNDGAMVTWRAFQVGAGQLVTVQHLSKMCPSPLEHTDIIIYDDFTIPSKAEGIIHQQSTNIESAPPQNVSENVLIFPERMPEEPVSTEENTCNIFPCTDSGCTQVFQTYKGLECHLLIGTHKYHTHTHSAYDEVRLKWFEHCNAIAEKPLAQRSTDIRMPQAEEPLFPSMGWALKGEKKTVRFSEKVHVYLKGVFDAGERSRSKANPVDVAQNMRVCRNEEGQKIFAVEEYLQPSQIVSYFSRLAAMKRTDKAKSVQNIDDDDLASALDLIEAVEAIEAENGHSV